MIETTADPSTAFHFTLMRTRLLDPAGNPVDDNDPEQWALIDALEQSDTPPDMIGLGRGLMTVLSPDESAFVREKHLTEVDPEGQYIRAQLRMDGSSQEQQPGIGDMVAVLLPDGSAVVYQIIIAASDLDASHAAHPPEPGEVALSLPPGHAILEFRRDLGCLEPNDDPDGEGLAAGAEHAKH